MTYKPEVLNALRELRHARAWRGTVAERKDKFLTLHAAFCAAYGKSTALVFEVKESETERGDGRYCPRIDRITLYGKISVVTYLHCFAKSFGATRRQAIEWSVNLYQRIFRRSAARMTSEGDFIVKPSNSQRN